MNRNRAWRIGFLITVLSLATAALTTPAHAAKVRIRAPRVRAAAGVSFSSAKLSRATNSVVVTFLNLTRAKSVTYTLSYTANGISQGVVGTLTPVGQTSDTRDLYFGTCSKGVCTPHYAIRNATLTVETTLTNGTTNVKRYRIKV